MRRQLARLHQVDDALGERLLEPLVLLVRTLQRYILNPLFGLLLTVGLNPFGLAILETRGHASGKIRRVPVGNGRKGSSFWIIAEHGSRAGWVHAWHPLRALNAVNVWVLGADLLAVHVQLNLCRN